MVYVNTLMGIAVTIQEDIINTVTIPGFETAVMIATRMHRGAGLVDSVNEKITRGGMVLPAILRDD
ncbi:hypothetical protein [Chitinophaga rhizophila]|uniref:Uncharacterized protein n=1 Tax=Chitinophaga rhizophila TaxID=2866212 RepID=A0ABS7GE47_9BACT|nr:hypothetical protein [Chitinophaga rhizophila]MBW8685939.1 hypothetical protein [Chitinophaga rhizophila]